jgi:hypothetical protein
VPRLCPRASKPTPFQPTRPKMKAEQFQRITGPSNGLQSPAIVLKIRVSLVMAHLQIAGNPSKRIAPILTGRSPPADRAATLRADHLFSGPNTSTRHFGNLPGKTDRRLSPSVYRCCHPIGWITGNSQSGRHCSTRFYLLKGVSTDPTRAAGNLITLSANDGALPFADTTLP